MEGLVWPQGWNTQTAYRIGKVLIDGSAVVNLMPEHIAKCLGLGMIENDDIVIRTATNEIRAIKHCTRFDIEIAGVVTNIRAYVIDIPQSYLLLLGRRWLYQVRVFGDYLGHTYTIYDTEGRPHEVLAARGSKLVKHPEVMLNPNKQSSQSDLTEREKEEIMLGQDKMQAIITRIVKDTNKQSDEWEEGLYDSDEEMEEELQEGLDSEGPDSEEFDSDMEMEENTGEIKDQPIVGHKIDDSGGVTQASSEEGEGFDNMYDLGLPGKGICCRDFTKDQNCICCMGGNCYIAGHVIASCICFCVRKSVRIGAVELEVLKEFKFAYLQGGLRRSLEGNEKGEFEEKREENGGCRRECGMCFRRMGMWHLGIPFIPYEQQLKWVTQFLKVVSPEGRTHEICSIQKENSEMDGVKKIRRQEKKKFEDEQSMERTEQVRERKKFEDE
ncbi:hypothetical protein BGX38DRAFT_1271106 [Terfezia claveryi]|nr:hypothetical protein BGX38DRAFT_1271106 [Terfezia claveryi]